MSCYLTLPKDAMSTAIVIASTGEEMASSAKQQALLTGLLDAGLLLLFVGNCGPERMEEFTNDTCYILRFITRMYTCHANTASRSTLSHIIINVHLPSLSPLHITSYISHTSASYTMSHISYTLCTCILYYTITSHTLSSPASYGHSATRLACQSLKAAVGLRPCESATHSLHV